MGLGVALLVRCLLWYVCFSDFGWFWLAVLVFMFWCCGLWVVWVSTAVVLTVVVCCFGFVFGGLSVLEYSFGVFVLIRVPDCC